MESFSSASFSRWDDDRAWFLKSGKLILRCTSDRATRWNFLESRATREIRPGCSHEETLHDGTAQSGVDEVIPRERSRRPDVDPQREARPQQFIIGNDEAELELSVESRSFVNRVNDQVQKRQRRISSVTENGENILWFGECSWL